MIGEEYTPPVPSGGKLERPDEPRHYRNRPQLHAPSYLRWRLENIEKLDLIPSRAGIDEGFYGRFNDEEDTVSCLLYPGFFVPTNCSRLATQNEEISRDSFRRQDYQRDMDGLWTKIIRDWLKSQKGTD